MFFLCVCVWGSSLLSRSPLVSSVSNLQLSHLTAKKLLFRPFFAWWSTNVVQAIAGLLPNAKSFEPLRLWQIFSLEKLACSAVCLRSSIHLCCCPPGCLLSNSVLLHLEISPSSHKHPQIGFYNYPPRVKPTTRVTKKMNYSFLLIFSLRGKPASSVVYSHVVNKPLTRPIFDSEWFCHMGQEVKHVHDTFDQVLLLSIQKICF